MTTETKLSRNRSFLMKLVLVLLVVIFAGVIVFQQMIHKGKADFAANKPAPINLVTGMKVLPSEWTPVIEAVGTIRPNQGAMLSSQAPGMISKILVKAGQMVKKGDLLVELDSSVEMANLQASEAQLPSVKLNYQRVKSLVNDRSASKTEFDKAQATYHTLMANIESLKATIKRRQIYAPFDGVAGIVKVNVGEYITVGTPIVRVEDSSTMKISFALAQTDVERVALHQKVTLTTDAITGETFAAQISAIDPAINKATGLFDVEATVTDANSNKLLSGMFARLRIALPTKTHQIVVPQIAVTYTMYGESAYILLPLSSEERDSLTEVLNKQIHSPIGGAEAQKQLDNIDKIYRAKQVEVTTEDRSGIYAQLSRGVKVGDLIVTGGFQRLYNDALVMLSDKDGVGTTQPVKTNKL